MSSSTRREVNQFVYEKFSNLEYLKLLKLRHLIKISMNSLDINCWNFFQCFVKAYLSLRGDLQWSFKKFIQLYKYHTWKVFVSEILMEMNNILNIYNDLLKLLLVLLLYSKCRVNLRVNCFSGFARRDFCMYYQHLSYTSDKAVLHYCSVLMVSQGHSVHPPHPPPPPPPSAVGGGGGGWTSYQIY